MLNYPNPSRAARLKKAGREGYRRVKKAAIVAWTKTARAAERLRRVAFAFLPSSGSKRVDRRRSAVSTSSVVPRAASPVTCARTPQAAAAASTEYGRESRSRWGRASPFNASPCLPFRVFPSALLPPRFCFRGGSPRSTASTAASTESANANRAVSSSAAASRAASSSPPLAGPAVDSTAASTPFFASACITNQSAASTSFSSVSVCSSLPRNTSSSSSAPSFSARRNKSDLLTNPAVAASDFGFALSPPAFEEADSHAETHAATHAASLDDGSASWKRTMSIAIPACGEAREADSEGGVAGKEPGETAEAAEELAECDRLSACAQDSTPRKGRGALAENLASALADDLSGAELADSASGPAHISSNILDGAASGGNAISALSPPPPSTSRFLSALRSSFRRSSADVVPVVVAGSNPRDSVTPVVTAKIQKQQWRRRNIHQQAFWRVRPILGVPLMSSTATM
ncbi:unnamed protein product [Closterium sp. Yama58-4]|nr:unnamed protein product [Closterium sp. Yama58-4]